MIVYNLFPLLAGRLPAWAPHIERAAAMGFDWLFVNPAQQPGASGSLYSIADYDALNPALIEPADPRSGEDQLRSILAVIRECGMRPMIDLVINHCAADAKLVSDHPNWIAVDADGSLVHPSCQRDGETVTWLDPRPVRP